MSLISYVLDFHGRWDTIGLTCLSSTDVNVDRKIRGPSSIVNIIEQRDTGDLVVFVNGITRRVDTSIISTEIDNTRCICSAKGLRHCQDGVEKRVDGQLEREGLRLGEVGRVPAGGTRGKRRVPEARDPALRVVNTLLDETVKDGS